MPAITSIVILTHRAGANLQGYLVDLLVREWRDQGIRVSIASDPGAVADADACLLHVDRSVVPQEYVEAARRFPIALNLHITDIRKTTYGRNRVRRGDGYEGPVIVKSALNYAGVPERGGQPVAPLRRRLQVLNRALSARLPPFVPFQQPSISSKADYRVLESRRDLPLGWLDRDDIVVERFRPERHGDKFVLREWYFLGDGEHYHCETSDDPVFTTGTFRGDLAAPPPPAIRRVRADLRIDYGKIDYAIDSDGVPTLFDVNKSIGVSNGDSPVARSVARRLALGLASIEAGRW